MYRKWFHVSDYSIMSCVCILFSIRREKRCKNSLFSTFVRENQYTSYSMKKGKEEVMRKMNPRPRILF